MPQTMTDQERECRRHLLGRKVFSVGHLTEAESRKLGYGERPLCITLDDNTELVIPACECGRVYVRRVRKPVTVLSGLPLEAQASNAA